ncbi:GTD-binding domain-containing protein [Heracleum sosnowskyi]|uniref:GTD-binding domain-containing protein n=1 Tax=Heracleum sosnowskyi TaxID=360622 RepID=A0AAD8MZC3_9APIA|nr:GTD-binding domain-containing protein [Heracleum sosnowskyi]
MDRFYGSNKIIEFLSMCSEMLLCWSLEFEEVSECKEIYLCHIETQKKKNIGTRSPCYKNQKIVCFGLNLNPSRKEGDELSFLYFLHLDAHVIIKRVICPLRGYIEREASSTAASEALSMILRLQNEKAAVKMEAEQFKRLAEEKMSYAEETMEIFEELVNQKEMEISALDFQVRAYRNKLLDIEFDDPGDGDMDSPENNLRRSEALMGATSSSSTSDRDFVTLVPPPRLPFIKTVHEVEGSETPKDDLISKGAGSVRKQLDTYTDLDKQSSYWEQIRELDDQVREITGDQSTWLKSPSPHTQLSSNGPRRTIKRTIAKGYDQLKHLDDMLEKEVCTNFSPSMTVHDVFEVPQPPENFSGSEGLAKKVRKAPLQDDERGEKPHFVWNQAFKQFLIGQDHDCLDRSQQGELSLSPTPDGESADYRSKIVQSTSACQDIIQKANNLLEISEIQSHALREGCTNDARVELQLLNEIQKQLNVIQSEINNLKPKKSSSLEDLRIHCLKEELLLFLTSDCAGIWSEV